MGTRTAIQWTDHTFNPWRGCTKVSPGCAHCYAETLSKRNPLVLGEWGPTGTRVLAAEAQWYDPLRWNRAAAAAGRRARVFCASLADVFDEWPGQMNNPDGSRAELVRTIQITGRRPVPTREPFTLGHARGALWDLIRSTPALDWQLLTKRPGEIAAMMPAGDWPNVWLGTSVESPAYLWRVDALLEAAHRITVPVRFISAEPLLAPLDLVGALDPDRINWLIVGGESGGGARPFQLEWARSLVDQCRAAGVACFVKQLGARPVGSNGAGLGLEDRKGGDAGEWPPDLAVREFPRGVNQ